MFIVFGLIVVILGLVVFVVLQSIDSKYATIIAKQDAIMAKLIEIKNR